MYNDLYNEMIVVLTLLLLIYALTIPLILNTDDKIKHVKWSALGLKNVLKSCEQKDIESISKEAQLLYDEYMQEKPSAKKIFSKCYYMAGYYYFENKYGIKKCKMYFRLL